eukprot:m51a1_g2711 hypothetical protein (572) ;mRNA; f:825297-827416
MVGRTEEPIEGFLTAVSPSCLAPAAARPDAPDADVTDAFFRGRSLFAVPNTALASPAADASVLRLARSVLCAVRKLPPFLGTAYKVSGQALDTAEMFCVGRRLCVGAFWSALSDAEAAEVAFAGCPERSALLELRSVEARSGSAPHEVVFEPNTELEVVRLSHARGGRFRVTLVQRPFTLRLDVGSMGALVPDPDVPAESKRLFREAVQCVDDADFDGAVARLVSALALEGEDVLSLLLLRSLRQWRPGACRSALSPQHSVYSLIWRAKAARGAMLYVADKAVFRVAQAAKDGHSDAVAALCHSSPTMMYVCGLHMYFMRAERLASVPLLKLASKRKYAAAQCSLGYCYDKGDGVQHNSSKAVKLYRRASKQGHALATTNLGACYGTAEGVQRDPVEALRLHTIAAEAGLPLGQFNLALCLLNTTGNLGTQRDPDRARKLMRLAAEEGHTGALSSLASELLREDPCEAVRLYRRAADLGNPTALCNLGLCYDHGTGVEHSKAEAAALYSQAVAHGSKVAHFNLGMCLALGEGTDQDVREASRLFMIALQRGDKHSAKAMATLVAKDLKNAH